MVIAFGYSTSRVYDYIKHNATISHAVQTSFDVCQHVKGTYGLHKLDLEQAKMINI